MIELKAVRTESVKKVSPPGHTVRLSLTDSDLTELGPGGSDPDFFRPVSLQVLRFAGSPETSL